MVQFQKRKSYTIKTPSTARYAEMKQNVFCRFGTDQLQCNQDPGYSIYCNSGSLTLPTSAQRVHLNSQPLWHQSQLEDQTTRIFWSNPNTNKFHQIKSKHHLSSPVLQWILSVALLTTCCSNISNELVLHVLVHEVTFSKPIPVHNLNANNFCSTTSWFQCGSWLYFDSKGGGG